MKFPNAAKGISKLYLAEILSLIAALATGFAMIFLLIAVGTYDNLGALTTGSVAGASFGLVCLSAAGVLALVAMILQIVGVFQASRDEGSFKLIIYVVIFGIIVTLIAGIFSSNRVLNSISQAVSNVVELLTTLLTILGICNLSLQLRKGSMVDRGHSLIKIILAVQVLAIIASLCTIFFWSITFRVLLVCLLGFSTVLEIAGYILFLVYLGDAKKMLQ